MRVLVFALVLANLGFWAFTAWFAPAPLKPARYDGPGITLLRELEQTAPAVSPAPPPSERVAGVAEPQAQPAPELRCVAVGPFAEPADAEAAQSNLVAAGFDPQTVVDESEVREGYWAYIPQLQSTAEARETLALLESEGVENAYIISDSDSGILISLGVYSRIEGAAALADEVSDFDLEATITERTRSVESRWIEFEHAADEAAAFEMLQQAFNGPLEQRDCTAEL